MGLSKRVCRPGLFYFCSMLGRNSHFLWFRRQTGFEALRAFLDRGRTQERPHNILRKPHNKRKGARSLMTASGPFRPPLRAVEGLAFSSGDRVS